MIQKADFTAVSSNIGDCAYNQETSFLQITFIEHSKIGIVKTATYGYSNVPQATWDKFTKSEGNSYPGSFFATFIKGTYSYMKLL